MSNNDRVQRLMREMKVANFRPDHKAKWTAYWDSRVELIDVTQDCATMINDHARSMEEASKWWEMSVSPSWHQSHTQADLDYADDQFGRWCWCVGTSRDGRTKLWLLDPADDTMAKLFFERGS